ncbi:MAG: T9SS type A sorting domain-containing protein [Saprospiraceae bacterium]
MKSLITILFFSIAVFNCTAQSLSLNMTEISVLPSDGISAGDLTLTNDSGNAIEIAVRLEKVCRNGGDNVTAIQICIESLCFDVVNETTVWGDVAPTAYLTLGPNESNSSFSFKQNPSNTSVADKSEWNLVLFDRNNPDDLASVNVKIVGNGLTECDISTSTTDYNYEIGRAYPNPAFETINIPYQIDANEADLNIYTSTGILVKTVMVSPQAEQVEVNVADFTSGIYFYNITDGKEQSKMMSFMR